MDFRAVADNLRESFRIIASSRGAGEIRELPGVSIASAGAAFQMFNAAFLSAPVESDTDLMRRIALAKVHFEARGLAWSYWVCEDLIEEAARRRCRRTFEQSGLRHSVDLPGMAASELLPAVRPLPGVEVRRVEGAAEREPFCEISASCFRVPGPWFREVFDGESLWSPFAAFVGYAQGQPVAAAAAILGGGAVGLYNLATLPAFRCRGYGEAIMRYALEDSFRRHGVCASVLQSTPAGLRIYERMGYRKVARFSVWAS